MIPTAKVTPATPHPRAGDTNPFPTRPRGADPGLLAAPAGPRGAARHAAPGAHQRRQPH